MQTHSAFKLQDNPEYGFLADGEGSAFYQYTLFSALSAMAAQQQPQKHQQYQQYQQQQQYPQRDAYVPQPVPVAPEPLPPDVITNWETVLNQLTGSKVGHLPFNRCQIVMKVTESALPRYQALLGCCVSRSPPMLPGQGFVDERRARAHAFCTRAGRLA